MASQIQTFTVSNKKTFPAGTDGRRLVTLSDLEGISDFTITADQTSGGAWVKVTKSYTDFSAAATSSEIEIYSLPAMCAIHHVITRPTTNFSGGAISDYDISVGISGNATKYCTAADVDSGTVVSVAQATILPESWTVATSIKATAASAGADLDAATAGSVTFYLWVTEIDEPA